MNKVSRPDFEAENNELSGAFSHYGKKALKLGIVLLLVAVGYQGFRMYEAKTLSDMQAAYLEAKTDIERSQFAQAYLSRPLGAAVALSLADEAFEQKRYENAAEWYQKSIQGLADLVLSERARVGHAASLLHLGRLDEAKTILTNLGTTAGFSLATRIYAHYTLGLVAIGAGQSPQLHIDFLKGEPQAQAEAEKLSLFADYKV